MFFFFNDTATTEIYTLSLHDALPIWACETMAKPSAKILIVGESVYKIHTHFKGFASYETGYATLDLDSFISRFADRKSTRLNSSHLVISYAVFCLKKNTEFSAPSSRF